MKILITNDDGIHAAGLLSLYNAVKDLGQITVVAPDTERSAAGHSITLHDPLRVEEVIKDGNLFGYAVNGTPADCVKIAVRAILKPEDKPDLVLSGINLGANLGISVVYSGTVSAATEGIILGIPSIAISLTTYENPNFKFSGKFIRKFIKSLDLKAFPVDTLLNINVPAIPEDEIVGTKVTFQGKSRFKERFDKRIDPHSKIYYWLTGEVLEKGNEIKSDNHAIKNKKVSISPIHYDMTNYKVVSSLENMIKKMGI